jgi:hypothetical protein
MAYLLDKSYRSYPTSLGLLSWNTRWGLVDHFTTDFFFGAFFLSVLLLPEGTQEQKCTTQLAATVCYTKAVINTYQSHPITSSTDHRSKSSWSVPADSSDTWLGWSQGRPGRAMFWVFKSPTDVYHLPWTRMKSDVESRQFSRISSGS